MRFRLPVVCALVLLAACSHDDGKQRAASVTTTTARRTTTTEACPSPTPTPTAVDGTEAEVVARFGDVQVAVVDHGASVDVVSLFEGCNLTPVSLDGSTAALPIGGTVTHGDGIRCAGDDFIVLSATSDDGETYQAKAIIYRLENDMLVAQSTKPSTIVAKDDPDTLRTYYELDC
ncbi:MAG: hypothetical protein V7636_734 [Actinomycetota bacterium]